MALIDRMQELLEAERAGVKCLDVMADHAADMGKKELFTLFRNDEGSSAPGCSGFSRPVARPHHEDRRVRGQGDRPATEGEQVALLIKGQSWWSADRRDPPGRRPRRRRRSSPTCAKCTSSISRSAKSSSRSPCYSSLTKGREVA